MGVCSLCSPFSAPLCQKRKNQNTENFPSNDSLTLQKWDLNASPLYRHIKTKSVDTAFGSTIKKTLLNSLKEEPEYDFLNISENISEDTLSELLAAEEEKELHH